MFTRDKTPKSRSHLALNLTIAFLAITFLGLLGFDQYRRSRPKPSGVITKGERLTISGLDWNESPKTLVTVLVERSAACSMSSEFYRRLQKETQGRTDVRFIAIFPDRFDDINGFRSRNGLDGLASLQASLGELRIPALPTIFVVDRDGQVLDLWSGLLGPLRQKEVFDRINVSVEDVVINSDQLSQLKTKAQVSIVDVRSRDSFRTSHLDGSVNIPADELPVRARDELDLSSTVVVDGRSADPSLLDFAGLNLSLSGFKKVLILR